MPGSREPVPNSSGYDEPAYVTEHRSAIATYLTCRVLIEIFSQSDNTALAPQLFEKLESIVFNQLERIDPASFETHPFREANFRIVGQLLGVMSSMNLARIARCFVNALKGFQKDLNVKGAAPRDIEVRAALMIDAMQHLHVRTQPEVVWRDSCDLIYTLGDLFVNSHGQLIKHTYCQALEHLVIPIAANWTPQVNTQRWKDFPQHSQRKTLPDVDEASPLAGSFSSIHHRLVYLSNRTLRFLVAVNCNLAASETQGSNDSCNSSGGNMQTRLDISESRHRNLKCCRAKVG